MRLIEHNGKWPTTAAVAFRRSDGLTATLLMNCNFPGGLGAGTVQDMIGLLSFNDSLWPTEDLFPDAL